MTDPILHFAHANGFPVATYQRFLKPLAEGFTLHSTDFLGHHPDFPVTNNWFSLCDHLIHDIEQHGQPIVGVGHSLGGGLMFMVSLMRPELFRAVYVLDVPLMTFWESSVLALLKRTPWRDRVTPAGRAMKRRAVWPSQEDAFAYWRTRPLFRRFPDDVLWDYVHAVTEQNASGDWSLRFRPDVEAHIFRTYPTNWVRHYRRRHVGLQVVVGQDTRLVKPHHRQMMAQKLGIPVHEVAGGHLFPLELPEASAHELRQLMANSGVLPHA
ncbi:alpha/beta fold hydrolase [Salinispirillum marinum]|uniref:Alpha/beta fold hydrolase n=2 Tax=Saccharospirillaceae TaxID=255527 RepID=A0ABV8BHK4_9GAMM